MKMKKIAIIIGDSNGSYPVPAVRGSAISILVEHLIRENSQIDAEIFFEVFSFYDKDAEKESIEYKNVKFNWIKIPCVDKTLKSIDEIHKEILTKLGV